ncbi:hypothetical protein [Mycoplasma sp. 'Moose RK']|uniref:hypothetical protein n=1 Tax=Mycoplasma sp. 'Moose RK' TaxID=2780095 RepID=UPI001E4DE7FD|nr:hypothetical protein [Mycoplasma sp. 'Moose RK']
MKNVLRRYGIDPAIVIEELLKKRKRKLYAILQRELINIEGQNFENTTVTYQKNSK